MATIKQLKIQNGGEFCPNIDASQVESILSESTVLEGKQDIAKTVTIASGSVIQVLNENPFSAYMSLTSEQQDIFETLSNTEIRVDLSAVASTYGLDASVALLRRNSIKVINGDTFYEFDCDSNALGLSGQNPIMSKFGRAMVLYLYRTASGSYYSGLEGYLFIFKNDVIPQSLQSQIDNLNTQMGWALPFCQRSDNRNIYEILRHRDSSGNALVRHSIQGSCDDSLILNLTINFKIDDYSGVAMDNSAIRNYIHTNHASSETSIVPSIALNVSAIIIKDGVACYYNKMWVYANQLDVGDDYYFANTTTSPSTINCYSNNTANHFVFADEPMPRYITEDETIKNTGDNTLNGHLVIKDDNSGCSLEVTDNQNNVLFAVGEDVGTGGQILSVYGDSQFCSEQITLSNAGPSEPIMLTSTKTLEIDSDTDVRIQSNVQTIIDDTIIPRGKTLATQEWVSSQSLVHLWEHTITFLNDNTRESVVCKMILPYSSISSTDDEMPDIPDGRFTNLIAMYIDSASIQYCVMLLGHSQFKQLAYIDGTHVYSNFQYTSWEYTTPTQIC